MVMSEVRGRGSPPAMDPGPRDRSGARTVVHAALWRPGAVLALAAGFLAGVPTPARSEPVEARPSLDRDIRPLLKARCIKCHGPNKPKGELNLASPRAMARGGSSGPAVEP